MAFSPRFFTFNTLGVLVTRVKSRRACSYYTQETGKHLHLPSEAPTWNRRIYREVMDSCHLPGDFCLLHNASILSPSRKSALPHARRPPPLFCSLSIDKLLVLLMHQPMYWKTVRLLPVVVAMGISLRAIAVGNVSTYRCSIYLSLLKR